MKIVEIGYQPFRWMRGFTPEEWHHEFELGIMQEAWRAFVRRVARDFHVVEAPYLYQREPNLRIHPPGGVAVPWHTDADFGHLPEEWNVWVPLTEITDDSQRLWLRPTVGDTLPETVEWAKGTELAPHIHPGSALIFRGATTEHGNQVNATDTTRVSFDFRLIEKRHYRDTGAVTVLYKVPLLLGTYWEEME